MLGAAWSFRGRIPGRKKIESGLNRLLSQPFVPILIQRGAVVAPGLWGPLAPQKVKKSNKSVIFGALGPHGRILLPLLGGAA